MLMFCCSLIVMLFGIAFFVWFLWINLFFNIQTHATHLCTQLLFEFQDASSPQSSVNQSQDSFDDAAAQYEYQFDDGRWSPLPSSPPLTFPPPQGQLFCPPIKSSCMYVHHWRHVFLVTSQISSRRTAIGYRLSIAKDLQKKWRCRLRRNRSPVARKETTQLMNAQPQPVSSFRCFVSCDVTALSRLEFPLKAN